jgi:hypothetical protein
MGDESKAMSSYCFFHEQTKALKVRLEYLKELEKLQWEKFLQTRQQIKELKKELKYR